MKCFTTEEFIAKARKVHGDTYDYSLTDYKGSFINIEIICPVHGVFTHAPHNHMRKGCPKCGKEASLITRKQKDFKAEFLKKAKKQYGDKYDFSLVDYKGSTKDIKIICPDHGVFEKSPSEFLSHGGCVHCAIIKRRALDGLIYPDNYISMYSLLGKKREEVIGLRIGKNSREIYDIDRDIVDIQTLFEVQHITPKSTLSNKIVIKSFKSLDTSDYNFLIKRRDNEKIIGAIKEEIIKEQEMNKDTLATKTKVGSSTIMSEQNSNVIIPLELGINENAPIIGSRYTNIDDKRNVKILGTLETFYQDHCANTMPIIGVVFMIEENNEVKILDLNEFNNKYEKITIVIKYAYWYISNHKYMLSAQNGLYFENDEDFLNANIEATTFGQISDIWIEATK